MVNVWRVETVNGKGIYKSGTGSRALEEIGEFFGSESSNRPMPYNDHGLDQSIRNHKSFKEHWIFGFASQRDYKAWFNSIKLRRAFANYSKTRIVVSLYRVSRSAVCFGNCQLRFNRKQAELIAMFRPDFI